MATCRLTRCLATAALLGLACRAKAPAGTEVPEVPPSLGTVTVKPIPPVALAGQSIELDQARLAAKSREALAGAGLFAGPDAKRASVLATIEVQPFVEGTEIGAKLRLRMSVRPEGAAPRFNEDAMAVGQAPLETREAGIAKVAFDRLAERIVGDLIAAYVSRQRLWSGNAKDVAAALTSTDDDLRVEALRIVGARKLRELLPSVLRLLTDEDENIRDAALGAVVVLQDRSAVRPLAESRQMRDGREMRKVLDAIASLGGIEARDYLAFVAENHDDEEIRSMAKAALERMTKRSEKGWPTK